MKIAIIPARGGSSRIPRKNIRDFHGQPIIAYSIQTALQSGLFDLVMVSTDDPEIAVVAHKHGARSTNRPPTLCRDDIGTQEVMKYELRRLEAVIGDGPQIFTEACCIYPCAPMMQVADLLKGYDAVRSPNFDYAHSTKQDFTTGTLVDCGNWYWGKAITFIFGVPLATGAQNVYHVPIPPERAIDINTDADWHRAEKMYAALHQEKAP